MNKFSKIRVFVFWCIVGVVLSEAEFLVWSLIYKVSLLNESALLIIPIVLFWLLNYHERLLKIKQKMIRHYFFKSILCISIGWISSYICLYYNADSLGVLISILIAIALILFLVCMKIIQLFYNKMKFRQVYFGYTVLGGIAALNIGYVKEHHELILGGGSYFFNAIGHGIMFFCVLVFIIHKYKKCYKELLAVNGIEYRQYIADAIKMTSFSGVLFIVPLRIIIDLV